MSMILVLDDDPHIQKSLEIALRREGHKVLGAACGEDALTLLDHHAVDLALVDLQLPGMSGIEFLRKLRDRHRDVEALIITAHGTVETAVEAMKEGALDYLTKPFSPAQVRHRVERILQVRGLRAEVSGLRRRMVDAGEHEMITNSPAVLHVLELARTAAASDVTVLISGESGTGKNLLARLVHGWSARKDAPFAVVDCTSFQETLLESELFGHKRGAFTGAATDRPGKVETAKGGTLLLDEIGEVPLAIQGKLLRLVDERRYERLGDPTPRHVDSRIIAATNRDLAEMVASKEFRQDLYYRLNVLELTLPPLRARPEDIPLLTQRFMVELCRVHDRAVEGLEPEVERFMVGYHWPGNVRELSHVLERAVLVCPGRTLRMDHLPPRLLSRRPAGSGSEPILPLDVVEEEQIRRALATGLPVEETARRLGIDPSTLWRKRKKYNI